MVKQAMQQIATLTQQIYDHVGYVEDWTYLPIDDCTEHFWRVDNDSVRFADTVDDLLSEDEYYENEFFRSASSDVYRGADYTAVAVDTHCDGNKFLQIFDNTKEINDQR
jgi:hypothetical protein